jgi:hypothetical protein
MKAADPLFWSIALGARERGAVRELARSAREVGVTGRIHVVTDAEIAGCECYDWMDLPDDCGFRMLTYWKAAAVRWPHDSAIYLDPWHRFYSRPFELAALCARSPIHIPLEGPLEGHTEAQAVYAMPAVEAGALLARCGLGGPRYFSRAALIMIRTRAIDGVFGVVQQFRREARQHGKEGRLALALTYAVQMLCGNRETHLAARRRDLWLPRSGLTAEERELLESPVVDWQRSVRLLSLPSLVHLGPENGGSNTGENLHQGVRRDDAE